ncbi:MAG: hypothetical protein OXC18_19290 [Desulfurellaceae bacterium]|nr:hypothetical protein [Desulfurellaceae bacterium]
MSFTHKEYHTALDHLPRTFNSYDFIRRLTQLYQQRYIEFLGQYPQSPSPFRAVHSQIMLWLIRSKTVKKIGYTNDRDIFGDPETVPLWERL